MNLSKLAIAAVLTLAASGAEAQTVYNDRNDWLAHVTGVTMSTFSGVVPANGMSMVNSVDGVDYTAEGQSTLMVFDASFMLGGSNAVVGTGANGYVMATFAQPITALGFDFGGTTGGQYYLLTSNGYYKSFNYTGANLGFSFLGITLDAPIEWARIGMTGGWSMLDNVSFGTYDPNASTNEQTPNKYLLDEQLEQDVPAGTTVTPEPGSFALLAAGLAGVVAVRRRRMRTAPID